MNKIDLANLSTPIVKLENLSSRYSKNIYLKRDDFTGAETSGNKVRKLEYAISEALDNSCDTIITAGALQSNHCRATAAVCARLGLACHLILRGEPKEIEGNLFLDYILGANIHLVHSDANIEKEMEKLTVDLENKGKKTYAIPVGASSPIGTYGYINAYEEILEQERDLNIQFDLVSLPIGSGGTYSGLWYGNYINQKNKKILGFSVSDTKEHFKDAVIEILKEIDSEIESFDSIKINDSYIGEGYALATKEELEFYYAIGKTEGIVLDPCYTGKAFRGLIKEIEKGNITENNILFIHTGGLMGWTKEYRDMMYGMIREKEKLL